MELRILDDNFRDIDVIDVYDSMIWTDRYSRHGDFEFFTPVNSSILDLFREDYYIWYRGSEHVMIIEEREVQTDHEMGNYVTITGRSLESILTRRIIWQQTILSGNFQNGIKRLLDENVISPTDPNRKIENFIFETSADPAITSLTIDTQFTGDNLYDVIVVLCEMHELGFKVTMNESSENMITKDSVWEHGHYEISNGEKSDYDGRIRLVDLIPVEPNTRYCFNTNNSDYYFVVRSYDEKGNFVASWAGIGSETIKTTTSNEYYLGVSIYDNVFLPTYEEYITMLSNGSLKPFIGKAIGDHIQKPSDTGKTFFVFKLYAGQDRSYDQLVNPYVVFSPNFDNLLNSNYFESKKALKTVTLVAGEGEGLERKTTTVGGGKALDRRELFTDARDLQIGNGEDELTDAEYLAQLEERGIEKLSGYQVHQAFDGQTENLIMFRYDEDYFMGDIVQLENEYGVVSKSRVTELIRSNDATGLHLFPTFTALQDVGFTTSGVLTPGQPKQTGGVQESWKIGRYTLKYNTSTDSLEFIFT